MEDTMPWKELSAMGQKREFIEEWLSGSHTVTELCDGFGISRATGHKYIRKFQEFGDKGLEEESRIPHHIPNRVSAEIEAAFCQWRRKAPRFGAEKILTKLAEDGFSPKELPALSTGNLILKRNGFIKPRKRFRKVTPTHPIFDPKACNEVWSADFKGKFMMGNREYCYPLTIADSYSRYVFAAKGLYKPTFQGCQGVFDRVFRENGIPRQIHTDNGAPFGCVQAMSRLSRLAVWFIELGIEPVYSDPGHPEQNGRHERMHRELKAEAARPPGYDLRVQQRKLNEFMWQYNWERPHKALNQDYPGKVHEVSCRKYIGKIDEWEYDKGMVVRYVCRNGAIRWGHSYWVGVSTTLAEKKVGLEETGNGIWRIYFRNKYLGHFDERVRRIYDNEGRNKRNLV
jgi:transposase InsO family protein